jgi:pimeloyl-ACP methyl ester carboxylesterase
VIESPSATATTEHVDTPRGRLAYRRFGPRRGAPLVLATRFRGTIDHWDPALLDLLAAERDVLVFDNVGTGRSGGEPPTTIDDLGAGLLELVTALELSQVDLLGWSLGGIAVQAAALHAPALVRRLVVAGSSPGGGVPGQPAPDPRVWQVATKPSNDDEDFLYLFFPDTPAGRTLGLASLRRIGARALDATHVPVSPSAMAAQLSVVTSIGSSIWDRVTELTMPVLVANGTNDVMIDAYASFAMVRALLDAKLVLYSDAGHGFLFQHIEDFAREVLAFLR